MGSDALLWDGRACTCRGMGCYVLLWDGRAVTCRGMGSDVLLWNAVQLLAVACACAAIAVRAARYADSSRLYLELLVTSKLMDMLLQLMDMSAHGYAASGRYLMCAV